MDDKEDTCSLYSGRIGQITKWFKGYPDGCKEIDPHLNNINIPVHILWGDQDAFLKADNAEQLHTRLHNSNLTIFKDCGHFFYQDKCSELITLLKSWVNGGYKQN